jgi:hypothetical protein
MSGLCQAPRVAAEALTGMRSVHDRLIRLDTSAIRLQKFPVCTDCNADRAA